MNGEMLYPLNQLRKKAKQQFAKAHERLRLVREYRERAIYFPEEATLMGWLCYLNWQRAQHYRSTAKLYNHIRRDLA